METKTEAEGDTRSMEQKIRQGHKENMTWMSGSPACVAAARITLLLRLEYEGDAVLTHGQVGTGSWAALQALGHH